MIGKHELIQRFTIDHATVAAPPLVVFYICHLVPLLEIAREGSQSSLNLL